MNVRNGTAARRRAWRYVPTFSVHAGSGGAQVVLTLEKALETATENSPTIKHQQMNLDRSRESLNAQKAALKTNLSLRLNPFTQNRDRRFDTRFSDWYTSCRKPRRAR